jgi:2-oxo-4-hydroxy-4-carboxy-5-ureidoimidazoline decarboxylase
MSLSTLTLDAFNALPEPEAQEALTRCCGSRKWVSQMLEQRPFSSVEALYTAARNTWIWLWEVDWQEAFSHHPKIGDIDSLRTRFASTREWAAGEQAGAQSASEETLQALAEGNAEYEKKFGYIFIVCATGKTAEEMLQLLKARLTNDPASELQIAAEEQWKITRLRLEKLLT